MMTGSVSGAAKLLFVTQPAVSKILQHTESRLGHRLFDRVKGRLVPTPEARRLFVEVQRMWRGVERVQNLSDHLMVAATPLLRLVVSPSLASWLVPTCLKLLFAEFPGVRARMEVTARPEATALLLDNAADIAISVGRFHQPNIVEQRIGSGRLVCAVPRGHSLAKRRLIGLKNIASEDLVAYEAESEVARALSGHLSAQYGLSARIEVRSSQAACWFVQQGVAVAIVEEFALMGASFSNVEVVPLNAISDLELIAAWNSDSPLSSVSARLVQIVSKHVRARGSSD